MRSNYKVIIFLISIPKRLLFSVIGVTDCPIPSKPLNGIVEYTGTKTNDLVTYSCPIGYNMIGQDRGHCLVTSQWEHQEPSCRRVQCNFPGGIRNGYFKGNQFSFDNRIRYVCRSGFKIDGNETRYCTATGQWDVPAPECIEIQCKLPLLSENTVVSNNKPAYSPEDEVTFSCTPGNSLYTSHDSVICQSDGTWDQSVPTCDPQTCKKPPSIPNGEFNEDHESYSVGFVVTYQCDFGYRFSERSKTTKGRINCLPSGEWESNIPECVIVTCQEPPEVLNARKTYNSVNLLSTVEYECREGYILFGESNLECFETGLWDPEPPICEPVDCGSLRSTTNLNIAVGTTTYESVASYQCDPGYTLVEGDSTRQCLVNGSWSGSSPKCIPKSCAEPDQVEHGYYIGSVFTFRSSITYQCDTGYILKGDPVRKCSGTGAWTPNIPPTCSKVKCNVPNVIEYGYYTEYVPFHFNDVVNYKCQDGYEIEGNATIQCQSNGDWSLLSVQCQPINCSVLKNTTAHSVNVPNLSFRSIAFYSCNEGYMVDEDAAVFRVCQADGSWSNREPCVGVPCPILYTPTNGNLVTSGLTFQHNATYSCKDGYRLEGDSVRVCLANRTWSGLQPSCTMSSCPNLPNPLGGSIDMNDDNLVEGTFATYSCNDGFEMEGESIRVCQPEGYWSGTAPSCVATQCPLLNDPQFGKVAFSDRTAQSVAIYTCDDGYQINGTSSRTCQSDGEWSLEDPLCIAVECPPLQQLIGGRIDIESYIMDGMATYFCNEGYEMVGENIRICQPEGYWSSSAPTCVATTCQPPSKPENGEVSYKDLHATSVAIFRCNEGYSLIGNDVIRCMSNLTWNTEEPICIEITCHQPPTISFGSISITGLKVNSKATVSCDRGYYFPGVEEVSCLGTGMWSQNFSSCIIKECQTPSRVISNGRMFGNDFSYGGIISYECDIGYNLEGSKNRTCLENGTWDQPLPSCEIVRCAPPRLTHGSASSFKTEYDTRVSFSCKSGYVLFGSQERTCLADGTWSGPAPKCVRCSNPPVLENGAVEVQNEIAIYQCNLGYTLFGNSVLECQVDGSWVNQLPLCVANECDDLRNEELENGRINQTGFAYRDRAIFECNTGYNLIGSNIHECQADGIWSEEWPVCRIVRCSNNFDFPNGRINGENTYGSSMSFNCNNGFRMVGDQVLTCSASGEWIGRTPVCEEIECPMLQPSITNGEVKGSGKTYGTRISYVCNPGFVLLGELTLTCLLSGEWSSNVPSCQSIQCPGRQLNNGYVSSRSTDINSSVSYTCNEGYVLFGSNQSVCLENGSWSSQTPTCTKCDDPPIVNHSSLTMNDKFATYSCDIGYQAVGNSILECVINGSWIHVTPVCTPRECEHLDEEAIQNGKVTISGYTFSDTIQYLCNDGYTMLGRGTRVCQADGLWSGEQPSCESVQCPAIIDFKNGQATGSNTYGSTMTFSCNGRPYQFIGSTEIVCQSTGTWSQPIPVCALIECERLPRILHGSVSTTTLTVDSIAEYSCDQGYELVGQRTRQCQRNRLWSGISPRCRQIQCPDPNPLQHGRITGNDRQIGSFIQYSCDDGYRLTSSPIRICIQSKMWSGSDPTCVPINCQPPSSLSNGIITNSKIIYQYRDTITYQCNEGYQMTGESERSCSVSGRWSGIAPACEIITCNPLNEINNAVVSDRSQRSYNYGTTLSIECMEGFTSILGSSVQTECTNNGDWSVKFIDCVRMSCPPLGKINDHVKVVTTGLSFNDNLTFSCDQGYRLNGPSLITCLSSGSWSAPQPTCELISCHPPEQFGFGVILDNNYEYGNTIRYVCNEGYRLSGNENRTCLATGRWSSRPPRCNMISCPLPQGVSNGRWNTSDVNLPFNTVLVITCNTGYRKINGSAIICSQSGSWTGNAGLCSVVNCLTPQPILNGNIAVNGLSYNSEIDYTCNDGYEMQGDSKALCLESGVWSKSPPTCEALNCGVPDFVDHADIIGNVYTYGNSITYRCNSGYIIEGEFTRICESNGRWGGFPPMCDPISCGKPPDVPNGVQTSTNYRYGATLSYICQNGYRIVGLNSLTCGKTRLWIGNLPSCKLVSCGPPPVIPYSSTIGSVFTYGSTVTYQCNDGYNLEGDQIATCEANGQWVSGSILCRPLECGQPMEISNGYVQIGSSTYGSTATYECNNRYSLVGQATVICGSRGIWEGAIPSCEPSNCGEPKVPNSVRVVGGGRYAIGDTIQFQCPEGHILIGNSQSSCLSSGSWSGSTPDCRYVSCDDLGWNDPELLVRGVKDRNYQYNDVVQFECDNGFTLNGESQITCLPSGSWSATIPTCRPISSALITACQSIQLIPNSKVIETPTAVGESSDVECAVGYQGQGDMTAVCLYDQTWRPPTGHCRRTYCGKPRITDMVNVVKVWGFSYFYNDAIRFRCRPGVLPSKIPPVITCTEDGIWDGEIACSLPCKGGCFNGGRCLGLYGCKCPAGFGGRHCERAYCILPCLNGGTCISPYLCSCPPGYRGTRCESPICDRPCQFGGLCIRPNMCHCKHGFRKPFCDPPNARTLPPLLPAVTILNIGPTRDSILLQQTTQSGSQTLNIEAPLITNPLVTQTVPATTPRTINIPGESRTITPGTTATVSKTPRPAYLDYYDVDFKVSDPN